jgi:hypothetical protein
MKDTIAHANLSVFSPSTMHGGGACLLRFGACPFSASARKV